MDNTKTLVAFGGHLVVLLCSRMSVLYTQSTIYWHGLWHTAELKKYLIISYSTHCVVNLSKNTIRSVTLKVLGEITVLPLNLYTKKEKIIKLILSNINEHTTYASFTSACSNS